jgi:DNA-binding ferritin-like protein
MTGLRLIVSGSNVEAIQKAVGKIRAFLDSVGAKYRFHDSGKSDSAYFHVREPAKVAEDPWNPDVVDTRVSDHSLPQVYDQPDLDVSVPKPRPKAVSPDFAVKLLKDFMKGKIAIDDGEVIPVDSSLKERSVFGFHGLYRKALYSLSQSFIQSKIVYHGTPGKVGDAGEFSTSFINTGEGAQAFGWGLYFAEDKSVAEWYQRKLGGGVKSNPGASSTSYWILNGEPIIKVSNGTVYKIKNGVGVHINEKSPEDLVLKIFAWKVFPSGNPKDTLVSLIDDIDRAIRSIQGSTEDFRYREVSFFASFNGLSVCGIPVPSLKSRDNVKVFLQKLRSCLDGWLSSGDYAKVEYKAPKKKVKEEVGYVYKVNIKVPDEYFLLEDSNWHGQTKYVQRCLVGATNSILRDEVQHWRLQKPTLSGNYFLRYLYKALGGKGSDFSDRSDAKMESVLLLKAGIHGFKFLDGKSRNSGEGSFNYVVIDENDLETVQHQVKDEETGQVDLFTQEQYVQPAKRAVASFQRILSAFSSGEGVGLPDLADLLNATQADIHFMHFYAGGQEGNWDELHDICSDYYIRLGDAYDDVAELCLQLDMDVSHPNDSASVVGFNNSKGSLGASFQYDEVMGILQDRIRNLVDTAAEVASRYQGKDPDSTAVRKYLEDFIAEWSKEAGYRLQGRLNGLLDFGGTYRDRVTDEQLGDQGSGRGLIAGDLEEPVF